MVSWRIPLWKSLLGLTVCLPLSGAFAYFTVRVVAELASTPGGLTLRGVFLAVVASTLGFVLSAFTTEIWIVAAAALLSRSPHASISVDEFHHFQLAKPIPLSSVRTMTIHGSVRVPRLAVTISIESPFGLRFPSPFNFKRLLWGSSREFTFLPGHISDNAGETLVAGLARVVRLNGGTVTM